MHIETAGETRRQPIAQSKTETEMDTIRHRVGIAAPAHEVFDMLATAQGAAQWWTHDVEGDGAVGSRLAFYFGTPDRRAVMEIVALTPDSRVEWRCVDGPDEWIDAPITFDLKAVDGETVVLFTHGGWRSPVEFMNHCSTKWAYFLLGLKAGLEGGQATPFPTDLKISSWG